MTINISKNGKAITSLDSWFELAPPRGKDKQWKDGYSAKEFARYVCSNSYAFESHMEAILKQTGADLICDFDGIPEATSDLGDGKNNNRKPDLLLIGDKCIVSIEAKVKESFGSTVLSAKKRLVTKDERPNYLTKYLFGDKTPTDIIDSLRYQLLTATVGTIEHAKKVGKSKAYMLVLEFKEIISNKETSNDKAFKAFCNALSIQPGGFISCKGITCWINKKTVQIDHTYRLL